MPKRPANPIASYFAECGRKGGLSRSAAKIAAGRINIAKATAARKKPTPDATQAIGGKYRFVFGTKVTRWLPHDATVAQQNAAIKAVKK